MEKIPKRKKTRYEKEKNIEFFFDDLDNEDEDGIFENTNLDSDSDTETDIDELDPIGEGDLNETVDLDNDVV